jgi:hypothetical protein
MVSIFAWMVFSPVIDISSSRISSIISWMKRRPLLLDFLRQILARRSLSIVEMK